MIKRNLNRWNQIAGIGLMLSLLVISLGIPHQSDAQTRKPRILYYNSATPDDHWWRLSAEVMEAACVNLEMDLKVVYMGRNPFLMVKAFKEVANGPDRPDAVVFQNLRQNAVNMLEISEAAKIPAFIFNAGLTDEQTATYGGPRERFKYWIGQMLPDDMAAGCDLALLLFREAVQLGLTDAQGKVHFIGINGTMSDTAAIERAKGLSLAIKMEPNIVLHQNVPGYWERERGKTIISGLISRYPMAKAVWVANDPMALGAIDGLAEHHLLPGKDMLVGSIDLIPEALQQVQKGQLVTSIGGHFMETAWVAVLLYDYFHQKDFVDESISFRSKMETISKTNINDYLNYFRTENFRQIDFAQFSKAKHPELKHYSFNFGEILRKLALDGQKKKEERE